MHVPAAISALIADPAPLHRAQECHADAYAAWRRQAGNDAVFESFAAFAQGAALSALPALAALFDPASGAAKAFAGGLICAMLPALAAEPLGQIPVRHQNARATTRLMLARSEGATMTLMALDGAALSAGPAPASVAFTPAEEWDAVIAGHGRGLLIERTPAGRPSLHPVILETGLCLGRDAAREALVPTGAEGPLVLLRLQRRREGPQPCTEVALADGRELRRAAASSRESRHALAAALLGAMGRADAAPLLAEIAGERQRGDTLRWEALRQCLGLATAQGFETLCRIARDAGDPLCTPAGAMRAALVERHPMLAELDRCRA